MSFFSAYLVAGSVALSSMVSLWLCSLALKDASIVDRFWGMGFVLIAWALALVSGPYNVHQFLLLSAISIWGLRLSIYIHLRNQGHPEDYRYQEMRKHHGKNFWWYSFLSVFLLQGIIMLIVAAPVILTLSRSFDETNNWLYTCTALLGTLIWLFGFIFEAGGDWQLSRFKSNPNNKGKLLNTGLWSLSRHPNYFGDACQWWGFGVFAFAYLPEGIFTFVGPIIMTFFIRKVSGVDLLEKSLKNKKPGYDDYAANVPPFFPRLNFWKKI